LFVRLLMRGLTGYVLHMIIQQMFPELSLQFKMFPFSTDPLYEQVNIIADDGSGVKHMSKNGNLWFSCDCPNSGGRYVEISLPSR